MAEKSVLGRDKRSKCNQKSINNIRYSFYLWINIYNMWSFQTCSKLNTKFRWESVQWWQSPVKIMQGEREKQVVEKSGTLNAWKLISNYKKDVNIVRTLFYGRYYLTVPWVDITSFSIELKKHNWIREEAWRVPNIVIRLDPIVDPEKSWGHKVNNSTGGSVVQTLRYS